MHGGPLWEPLCYAQIGGLTIATFVTLLLVPVLYSIFVLDLKWIRWEAIVPADSEASAHAMSGATIGSDSIVQTALSTEPSAGQV